MSKIDKHADVSTYVENYKAFQKTRSKIDPTWLASIREEAITVFGKAGFPTRRNEAWKYTNLNPLQKKKFSLSEKKDSSLSRSDLNKYTYPELNGHQAVFVNGWFVPSLSDFECSLADALQRKSKLVKSHLNKVVSYKDNVFTALNSAFFQDGAFIYVPRGECFKKPIHLIFISTKRRDSEIAYIRNLIVAEPNSDIKIIESYISLDEHAYFTNVITEVSVQEGARVEHCKIQNESNQAFHFAKQFVDHKKDGHYFGNTISLGGMISRSDISALFNAQGGDCQLNGFFNPTGNQKMDHHLTVDHAKPNCHSKQLYKGVLDEKGRGVFDGKIFIQEQAQQTSAHQTNKNLLLSKEAMVFAKPHLEIHADDVQCTHGSSTGQLDEKALFYLRSRGVDEKTARSMLVRAFAQDVIDKIPYEPVRKRVNEQVFMRRAL